MRWSGLRRRIVTYLAAMALASLVLTGCGAAGAVGGGGARSTGSVTPPPTAPSPCAGSAVGPITPNVTLGAADENHATSVSVGAVVEIRLDGQHLWRAGSVTPTAALTPIGPQGALEQGACVWEFRVVQRGDAVVTFIGTALCPPNAMCPQYAMLARFTVRGV
ncbi:MAG TPA: hypothetical protein VFN78_01545 [Ktedonobacterales bacterium]|nr:hypothetical protein [Ktedonobacterales bacterium]